jgi:putative phage-type endonuclease
MLNIIRRCNNIKITKKGKYNDQIDHTLIKKKSINIICVKKTTMEFVKKCNHEETLKKIELDLEIFKSIKSKNQINYNSPTCQKYDKETIDKRRNVLISYKNQLARLKKLPLIKQRTIEWLEARKSRLTASDLEDALKQNNLTLAKKKAGITKDVTNYTTIPPLKWGTMFEDMACRVYSESLNNIHVSEFGLVIDEKHEHFGASPDGINDMGIMIEIKCPFSRTIKDGYVPSKYYMQIQGQLAVCSLNECDYVECKFIDYESIYKYLDDLESNYNNMKTKHGIIAEYRNLNSGEYFYIYSDSHLSASDTIDNINKKVLDYDKENEKNKENQFIKLTPWRLENMNIQRVYFDEKSWKDTLPKITAFWDKVEECKKLPIEEVKTKSKIKFIPDND